MQVFCLCLLYSSSQEKRWVSDMFRYVFRLILHIFLYVTQHCHCVIYTFGIEDWKKKLWISSCCLNSVWTHLPTRLKACISMLTNIANVMLFCLFGCSSRKALHFVDVLPTYTVKQKRPKKVMFLMQINTHPLKQFNVFTWAHKISYRNALQANKPLASSDFPLFHFWVEDTPVK